jgi:hypothetical protein
MELRMSGKERERLKVMAALAARRLKQSQAARLLRLSVRRSREFPRRPTMLNGSNGDGLGHGPRAVPKGLYPP